MVNFLKLMHKSSNTIYYKLESVRNELNMYLQNQDLLELLEYSLDEVRGKVKEHQNYHINLMICFIMKETAEMIY